ncbi:MAG: ABC transporter substrate-binding protein [Chloroflexi bacterium]|nr:ABC transporter substrate-binding protein [Chloroflexota bacterium]
MKKLLLIATLLAALVGCAAGAPSPVPPTPAEKAKPAVETAPKAKEAEAKPAAPAAKEDEAKPAAPKPKEAEAKPATPKAKEAEAKTPAKLDKIRVVYSIIAANSAPLWLAYEQGLFKKNGLDVELQFVVSTSNAAKALAGGEFQFATMGGEIPVRLTAGGTPTALLAVMGNYFVFSLFSQPSLTKPEDLRGKKVGVTAFGSGTDAATRSGLRKLGLEPDRDYTILQSGGMAEQLAAMKAGGLDAGTYGYPFVLSAAKAGFKELVDFTALQIPFPQSGLGVLKDYVAKNEDVVRRFVKGYVEGIAVAKRDKALTKKILRDYAKLDDEEVLEVSYDVWITKIIERAPYPLPAAVQQAIDTVSQEDANAKSLKPEQLIESRFIKELEDSGFIKSLY